jgi:hypothetical protein
LSTNGLASAAFTDWFNMNPNVREVLMAYIARCALPQGRSLFFFNPVTRRLYRWRGQLGLAPDWSMGRLPTQREQQLVSACLAAHINKYGVHVAISLQGTDAKGVRLPTTAAELQQFSEREACFFGNVFTGEGVFAANDRALLTARESTSRACGLASEGQSASCGPLTHVGSCSDFCTLDPTGTYYTQCSYNRTTYAPLTTRIRPSEIFRCGDRVCQFTESCGAGTTAQACASDCGPCR